MQYHLHLRDAAVRRIQRIFRGWRTRHRVVHQVRRDVELLFDDIRRELGGEWTLLEPQAAAISSFSLDWGNDGKLRLPRMEDSFFGVSVSFPANLKVEDDDAASVDEQDAELALDSEQEPSEPSSPVKAASLNSEFEERSPFDKCDIDQVSTTHSLESQGANARPSTRDTCVSAVETHGTTLQEESDECQAETTDKPLQRSNDGSSRLDRVQEILATHSRAEVLLELEWVRQALRDRRKYLRSKRRVERACA